MAAVIDLLNILNSRGSRNISGNLINVITNCLLTVACDMINNHIHANTFHTHTLSQFYNHTLYSDLIFLDEHPDHAKNQCHIPLVNINGT